MSKDISDIILNGLVFNGAPKGEANENKVRTKARKKKYITGAHDSDSARQKAKYRWRRLNKKKR